MRCPPARACRARLSYEQFSQFLVAIKELNAGRTSREDTLGAAKALFGPNNLDLYGESVHHDTSAPPGPRRKLQGL